MSSKKVYQINDRVFAKIRGYPPWPAKILAAYNTPSGKKYTVYFYGTGECTDCKPDVLFPYEKNKIKLGKPNRRKYFAKSLIEIENDQDKSIITFVEDHAKATSGQKSATSDINLHVNENASQITRKPSSTDYESVLILPNIDSYFLESNDTMDNSEISSNSSSVDHVSQSDRKIKLKQCTDYQNFDITSVHSRLSKEISKSSEKQNNGDTYPFHIELDLLDLTQMLCESLQVDGADCDKAIWALKRICLLKMTPLMLKKNYMVVDTIKKITNYVGNSEDWDLNEEDILEHSIQANHIRKMAEKVLTKIISLFTVSYEETFDDVFKKEVDEFYNNTKHLSSYDINAITSEKLNN